MAALTTAEIVNSVIDRVTAHYVFPERAAEVAAALRGHLVDGRYDPLAGGDLCTAVSADIQTVWTDPHLRLIWHDHPRPDWDHDDWDEAGARAAWNRRYLLDAQGVHRVERLAGNVGLIELRGVGDPEFTGPAYAAAMQLVATTYALILDLRRNIGGAPDGVALFCSYLFPSEPVHLNDIYTATDDRTHQYWTLPYLPAPRYLDRPVFVLTSPKTFSAGEEICYNLQALRRATLIGETTKGGAHPSDTFALSAQIDLRVPTARSINPVTGTNWEGVGVVPDVPVPAADALDRAYTDALHHVLSVSTADTTDPQTLTVRAEAEAALAERRT